MIGGVTLCCPTTPVPDVAPGNAVPGAPPGTAIPGAVPEIAPGTATPGTIPGAPGTAPGTPAASHCETQAAATAKNSRLEKTGNFFIIFKSSTSCTKAIVKNVVFSSFAQL